MSHAAPHQVLLEIRNLNKNFGGLQAISDVSMDLPAGVITTLVGPNGAGKTTLFNMITGHLVPSSGTVHWLGQPLKGIDPWKIARMGIARTFQDLRLFSHMTVEENIMTRGRFYGLAKNDLAQAFAAVDVVAILRAVAVAGGPRHGAHDRRPLVFPQAGQLLLEPPVAGRRDVVPGLVSHATRVAPLFQLPRGRWLGIPCRSPSLRSLRVHACLSPSTTRASNVPSTAASR